MCCSISTHFLQDSASEHRANLLLLNFWLSEPRPLLVRLLRPCRAELPPSLRPSPSPARPLRPPPALRRAQRLSRHGRRGSARPQGTRLCPPHRRACTSSKYANRRGAKSARTFQSTLLAPLALPYTKDLAERSACKRVKPILLMLSVPDPRDSVPSLRSSPAVLYPK
jgi:hypothetical protein